MTYGDVVKVLVPYKITLLSNRHVGNIGVSAVLVPYKITLLSNSLIEAMPKAPSFSTL